MKDDDDDQFDLDLGERLRDEGMDRAAHSRKEALAIRQAIVIDVAIRKGEASADDAQRQYKAKYGCLPPLGNAAGSLFRGGQWEFTGRWRKSKRTTNHARQNRIWRLRCH